MPELAKLVVSALNSGSLEGDPNHEVALDRVMAFALAAISDPLGAALFRLRFMDEIEAYSPALKALTSRTARPGESRRSVARVCGRALDEWFFDLCEVCGGRGHMVVDGTPIARHACASCGGAGRQPPSIQARCAALGLSPEAYPKWEPRLARAHQALGRSEAALVDEIAVKLGRAAGRQAAMKKFMVALCSGRRILPGSRPPAHNNNTTPGHGEARDAGAQQ